ncbi:MAG: ferrous iron transport protein A [Caldimicrobium sp.]|nr:ferrous iron transport protein A [Caldimicrobium sp.]MCX7872948.1 ferrous iron transport protein A [Caldimicrobium sp.]
MRLSELKPGAIARIVAISSTGSFKKRLQEMGALPGEIIRAEKTAPLGDPIEITSKGYSLSLRKSEVEAIVVEEWMLEISKTSRI